MPRLSQKQIMIIATAAILVLIIAVFIFANLRGSGGSSGKVTLHVWGFDPQANFTGLLAAYRQYRSNVTVTYTEIPATGYKEQLLTALAGGSGPDVFMIGNHDVAKLKNVLTPAFAALSLVQFQNAFPQAVQDDFVNNGKIYAAPLFLDSLATIYNKDLLNNAGIAVLPAMWNDFVAAVPSLRMVQNGTLTQSAAAIGGTERTVDKGMDLLSLLMLQNGTQMTDASHEHATFSQGQGTNITPGLAALNFYLQFANSASPTYTWNENGGVNSLDGFAGGKTAIIFNYRSTERILETKSPFLHIGIAYMPQPAGSALRIDYADYAGLAVSKTSANQNFAWDFVIYATTNSAGNGAYLKASGEPAALRSTIAAEETDPELAVFAKQALTARSWYEIDKDQIHAILSNAVSSALSGQVDSGAALRAAEAQVTQLMTQ